MGAGTLSIGACTAVLDAQPAASSAAQASKTLHFPFTVGSSIDVF
jgi:hypothetical protein